MRRAYAIAAVTLALVQASKIAVVDIMDLRTLGEIEVAPPYLVLRMAWNRGINFGLFSGGGDAGRWILVAIALVVTLWVWRWAARILRDRPPRAGLIAASAGLLAGGAIGNAIDRLLRPEAAVADFINMSCCGFSNPYAFNVADIAIFAGIAGLLLLAPPPKASEADQKRIPPGPGME